MTGGSTAGATGAPQAGAPTERLSWMRLGILLLVVSAVIGTVVVRVRDVLAEEGDRALSWSVPYVDVTLWPTYQFQDPRLNPARDVALAFVVADPDERCEPSWGAAYTLDEAGDQLELDRRIEQLRSAGGDVLISFGGQANDELAVACGDDEALAAAYRAVIERYDVDVIDLDIEGPALDDTASIRRRAEAIAAVQQDRQADGEELAVWVTLPVATSGLTGPGVAVVEAMLDAEVDDLGVNVMTMNYNEQASPRPDMFESTERALTATAAQIGDIYARRGMPLDEGQRWAVLGATPMIGQNDVDTEVFTLDDAHRLAQLAQDRGLRRLSLWSLNRDQGCQESFADVVVHSNTCSGIDQESFAFIELFNSLPGRPPAAPATPAVTVPYRTGPDNDQTTAPYPIWRPTAQYAEGYKVVWLGSVYQAKWYNQGTIPGAQSSDPWTTPWALIGPVDPSEPPMTLTTVPAGSLPEWDPTALYEKGTEVAYDGLPYVARWSTKGDAPMTEFPVDPGSPWEPQFDVPGAPTR